MEQRTMRVGATTFVLLLCLSAHAAHADDDVPAPDTIEASILVELDPWREPIEPTIGRPWRVFPGRATEAAERLVARIEDATIRVGVTAYAFDRLSPALRDLRDRTVLRPEDRPDVVALVEDGGLSLLHATAASGSVGHALRARLQEQITVVRGRDLESAIGAVVSFPEVTLVRVGLRMDAVAVLTAAPGVTLRYQVTLSERPTLAEIDSVAGTLDRVAVPALLVRGTVRLVPGEVATIWRIRPDGSGRLLLLALDGTLPDVELVTAVHGDVVAVRAGHFAASAPRTPIDDPVTHGEELPAESGVPDGWAAFTRAAGIRMFGELPPTQHGLRFERIAPGDRERVAALLARGAKARGRRDRFEVKREGFGALSFPTAPGTAFRFFAGTVASVRCQTVVESGCNDSVLAAPAMELEPFGLRGQGFACVDGTTDVMLVGREVLGVTAGRFALRRIEPGYKTYARDPLELPLVRERTLLLRCALPEGGGRLPGGVDVRWAVDPLARGDGVAVHLGADVTPDGALPIGGGGFLVDGPLPERAREMAPIALRVGDEPFSVRPGVPSRLVLSTYHPFVRSWDSDGWCGMTARFPVADRLDPIAGTVEGTSLELVARRRGGDVRLDASAEIRGAPEDLGGFDPGDGIVSIVRSPRLAAELFDLSLGGGGRLAEGAGLALEIVQPGVEAALGPHLVVGFVADGRAPVRVRTGPRSNATVVAGAEWSVPAEFQTYVSNHASGHVRTNAPFLEEGVRLETRWSGNAARVDMTLRARPSFTTYALQVGVEPDRPETHLRLLAPTRRVERRALFFPRDGRLAFENPTPSFRYRVTARVVPKGGSK